MSNPLHAAVVKELSEFTAQYSTPIYRLVTLIGPLTKDSTRGRDKPTNPMKRRRVTLECDHDIYQCVPMSQKMPAFSVGETVLCDACTKPSFNVSSFFAMDRWARQQLTIAGQRRMAPWLPLVRACTRSDSPDITAVWKAVKPLLAEQHQYPLIDELLVCAASFARLDREIEQRQAERVRKHLPELVRLIMSDPVSRPEPAKKTRARTPKATA